MPDQVVTELPNWLVRHICHPENHRLAKMPEKWTASTYSYRGPQYSTGRQDALHHMLPSHYRETERVSSVAVRHLDNNDYRLWSEVRQEFTYQQRIWNHDTNQYDDPPQAREIKARCRWCYQTYSLKDFASFAKRNHKNICAYTHNLKEVYAIQLRKRACILCRRATKEQRWGIPICGELCSEMWCSERYPSFEMRASIADARQAGVLRDTPSSAKEKP